MGKKLAVSGAVKDISMVSISRVLPEKRDPTASREDIEMANSIQQIDGDYRDFGISVPLGSPMEGSPESSECDEMEMNQAFSEGPHHFQFGVGSHRPTAEAPRVISGSPLPTDENIYEETCREDVGRII